MAYLRVIPRDLFNESKLLKCFGQLALKVLDGMVPNEITITIDETGEPFEIDQTKDGYLFITNYETTVNGESVTFVSTYNSKSNYPFYCWTETDAVEVFDDQGNFTTEFIAHFSGVTK